MSEPVAESNLVSLCNIAWLIRPSRTGILFRPDSTRTATCSGRELRTSGRNIYEIDRNIQSLDDPCMISYSRQSNPDLHHQRLSVNTGHNKLQLSSS